MSEDSDQILLIANVFVAHLGSLLWELSYSRDQTNRFKLRLFEYLTVEIQVQTGD